MTNAHLQWKVENEHFKNTEKNPTDENHKKYKSCGNLTNKTICKAETQQWRQFCQTLGPKTPTTEVWKKLGAVK